MSLGRLISYAIMCGSVTCGVGSAGGSCNNSQEIEINRSAPLVAEIEELT